MDKITAAERKWADALLKKERAKAAYHRAQSVFDEANVALLAMEAKRDERQRTTGREKRKRGR